MTKQLLADCASLQAAMKDVRGIEVQYMAVKINCAINRAIAAMDGVTLALKSGYLGKRPAE